MVNRKEDEAPISGNICQPVCPWEEQGTAFRGIDSNMRIFGHRPNGVRKEKKGGKR